MRVVPLGDSGLLVEVRRGTGAETAERVLRLNVAMKAEMLPGVTDVVPSYTTVGVHFDPRVVGRERVRQWIERRACDPVGGASAKPREIVIPVCYGGTFGPDLEAVSDAARLAAERVVELHAARVYTVRAIGFVPGFAYMSGLDVRLHTVRRRATPRARVLAGSVAIAAGQAAVYPIESPGGWQLIGRTPMAMFRPDEARASLLQVGDAVRFESVTRERFEELAGGR